MQGDGRHGGGGGIGGGGGRGDDNSETLVFGRACDRPTPSTHNDADISTDMLLPWEQDASPSNDVPCKKTVVHLDELEGGAKLAIPAIGEPRSNCNDANPFPCKYCPRSFRERRSLRNHMASLHPDCYEVRFWDEEKLCATMKSKKKEKIDRKRKSSTSDDGGDGKCNETRQTIRWRCDMRPSCPVSGKGKTTGDDEEDIPEQGSAVGASARQALWRAPEHQARLASPEQRW
jgi:hypothetical protein